MYVQMYVYYMNVGMYISRHTLVYVYAYTSVCIYAYVCKHTCIIYMDIHMYGCVYVYVYMPYI